MHPPMEMPPKRSAASFKECLKGKEPSQGEQFAGSVLQQGILEQRVSCGHGKKTEAHGKRQPEEDKAAEPAALRGAIFIILRGVTHLEYASSLPNGNEGRRGELSTLGCVAGLAFY